jgi:hypothetical protein
MCFPVKRAERFNWPLFFSRVPAVEKSNYRRTHAKICNQNGKTAWIFTFPRRYNPEILPAMLIVTAAGRRKQDIGIDTNPFALVRQVAAVGAFTSAARNALK